jgi:predicted O-linked N-acetylglucosamine transferase (SPINDLY family)
MFWQSLLTTDKVIEKMPDSDEAYQNLSKNFWGLGMPNEAHAACEKAVRLKPDRASNHDNLLHTLNYLPEINPSLYLESHLRYAEIFEKPILTAPHHTNSREPERKLRIAYMSPDLRSHSVCHFIEPILRGHDRSRFEIFGIYTNPWRDSTTDRLEQLCATWIEAARLSDEELADRIRAEQIDILVDLACHTSGNRLLVFPRRPAPIQITMIGMQQTTGLLSMNYRITDADMDPPGMTESLHTETLLRLQRGFVFTPPESREPVGPLPALRSGHITFGSFNNFAKTHPGVLQAWATILARVPNSRLGAVVPEGAAFESYFEAAGIAPERIFRMERASGDAYLRMHHACDIALDCFPFAGLTVSLFAAWMGVPTVTIAGRIPSARGGVSILRGLGLDEYIATDTEEFVERAVALASDWGHLARIRSSMRERMEGGLCNPGKFLHDYETQLRRVWRDWCLAPG